MMNNDECDEIPSLHCVKCYHDLNHPLYLLCTHPMIPSLPVCILCYEELNNIFENYNTNLNITTTTNEDQEELLDISDICSICGDGGDLLLCSNEECNHAFCVECIEKNFNINELNRVKDSNDWSCYSCCCYESSSFSDSSNSILDKFKQAIEIGKAQSMYCIPLSINTLHMDYNPTTTTTTTPPDIRDEVTEDNMEIMRDLRYPYIDI